MAAAPSQTQAIAVEFSTVQGVNFQDVMAGINDQTRDTTNDGFDDIAPVKQSAAQDNEASPTTLKT